MGNKIEIPQKLIESAIHTVGVPFIGHDPEVAYGIIEERMRLLAKVAIAGAVAAIISGEWKLPDIKEFTFPSQ